MHDDQQHQARWLTIYLCGYSSLCRAPQCDRGASITLAKSEANGRFLRQIELCQRYAEIVVRRERAAGLGITERRARLLQ